MRTFLIFVTMSSAFLETPIEYLKGVGAERAKTLKKELRIETYGQLLDHFPFRYIDRSKFEEIADVHPESPHVQLRGILVRVEEYGHGKNKRLSAVLKDDTGKIELVWFKGVNWVKPKLHVGREYVVFGKPSLFQLKLNIAHPEIEQAATTPTRQAALEPVYSSTEKLTAKGLNSKGILKLMKVLVSQIAGKVPEVLPASLISKYQLLSREASYREIHQPSSEELKKKAVGRLKFEEFFMAQLHVLKQKFALQQQLKGIPFPVVGDHFHAFYNEHLPFPLTGAQKKVLKEIRHDVGSGRHMNRLLQGDVGSGKTMVALLTMLIALDNGYQTTLLAPTEILANQHNEGISEYLAPLGLRVELLTGSVKGAKRREILEALEAGEIDILIGTHALFEDHVVYKNLGLVIIDEQHRFGVAQRARMWKKNEFAPHILVMTATPIPRTLAMTVYGDLDVSIIDEMPPGRKPVKTVHRYDSNRSSVFGFMKEQIALGHQVYVVYPLIQESAKMDYKDLMDGYESISRSFPLPDYRVSIVHGRMKAADKDFEMQRFVKGETQIMVATTVIEVGVNVPNASVMIIESSERFGLSQLHQLRGRVGRGADQAFCVLMTGDKMSAESKKRIQTMVETTDGFKIAEADLQLRGPGDLSGTQQSGILEFKLADLTKDGVILQHARKAAMNLLEHDPGINKTEHKMTAAHLNAVMKNKPNWSRIS